MTITMIEKTVEREVAFDAMGSFQVDEEAASLCGFRFESGSCSSSLQESTNVASVSLPYASFPFNWV